MEMRHCVGTAADTSLAPRPNMDNDPVERVCIDLVSCGGESDLSGNTAISPKDPNVCRSDPS